MLHYLPGADKRVVKLTHCISIRDTKGFLTSSASNESEAWRIVEGVRNPRPNILAGHWWSSRAKTSVTLASIGALRSLVRAMENVSPLPTNANVVVDHCRRRLLATLCDGVVAKVDAANSLDNNSAMRREWGYEEAPSREL